MNTFVTSCPDECWIQLPGQHFLKVSHNISDHSPQCWAEVHVLRVLNSHGVPFTVVEPKVPTVFTTEAGTWETDGERGENWSYGDVTHVIYETVPVLYLTITWFQKTPQSVQITGSI